MSWPTNVRFFSPAGDPALGDPTGVFMDTWLMMALDRARADAGVPFVVTSGWRSVAHNAAIGGAGDSAHLAGHAVDGYFDGMSLLRQFVHLARYTEFQGIGVYPHTTPPTVHVDTKIRTPGTGITVWWVRTATGTLVYAPSGEFLAELRELAAR